MPVLPNEKHEAVAQGLAMGHGRYKAYKRAGYRPKNEAVAISAVSRLFQDPAFRERVSELSWDAAMRYGVTKGWVIQELVRTYNLCLEAEPVVNRDGEVVGYKRPNLKAAPETLRLIGQEIDMFRQRHSLENPDGSGLFEAFLKGARAANDPRRWGEGSPYRELSEVEDAELLEGGEGDPDDEP